MLMFGVIFHVLTNACMSHCTTEFTEVFSPAVWSQSRLIRGLRGSGEWWRWYWRTWRIWKHFRQWCHFGGSVKVFHLRSCSDLVATSVFSGTTFHICFYVSPRVCWPIGFHTRHMRTHIQTHLWIWSEWSDPQCVLSASWVPLHMYLELICGDQITHGRCLPGLNRAWARDGVIFEWIVDLWSKGGLWFVFQMAIFKVIFN